MDERLGGSGPRSALESAGTVGHDLLAVDWSGTPLGPPESWPASLVTVVRAVLSSRFSMWMAWGPQFTFFCNDAYRRATLGSKYPWALGRPASEVWEEIWPDIGPRIERVISTGEATWDESLLLFVERSGYVEESYHTFSYSPLRDDGGVTAGMLCVVTEDTDRVIGGYQMATLRDLGLETAGAADEEAFLDAACRHLAANGRSLPFSLIYLFESEAGPARRAAVTGIEESHRAAPAVILERDGESTWPLEAIRSGGGPVLVRGLAGRFGELPTGAWSEPPTDALVLALPGQAGHGAPYGFLVAALNRYRPLDDDYRSFLGLIAGQLAAGIARARAYDAERRRAQDLAELDAAKTTFFTNVSHELRTPLTLLLGPANDALADAEQPLLPAQRARTEVIARNGERLLKLVNELLDFSRLESGSVEPRLEPIDLAAFTAELAELFRPAVEGAGLDLTLRLPELGAPVPFDREMWTKIVFNLLSNALKFTFRGAISVELARAGENVVLSVSDTGIGIPPGEQKRLFERFHRVSGVRARSHEGSGIGLALVAELAALHGGVASVASVPEQGSTFAVAVPAGAAGAGAALATQPDAEELRHHARGFLAEIERWEGVTEQSARTAEDGGGTPRPGVSTVLIVDDNADMREYLCSLLAEHYSVRSAADGAQALEMIRQSPPDLVISDAMMPVLDGFELLSELRSAPATQQIPVIMVSARAGEAGTIEGLRAGADDYLIKPFSAPELLARVRSNLGLASLRLEATARVDAERRRLEAVLDQLPAGVVIVEAPSGRQLMANRQVTEILGHEPLRNGVAGRVEYRGYDLNGDPLAADRYPIVRSLQHGETVRGEDMIYHSRTGRRIVIRVNSAPVRDRDGEIIAGVSVFQDVTERVRAERLLSAQRDTLAMIAAGAALTDTLERVVLRVEAMLERPARASVMLRSGDGRSLLQGAAPNLPAAYNEAVDGIPVGPGVGSCGTAAHLGQTVIAADIASDELWRDFRELALDHGLRACWSTPVQSAGGQVIGTLAVYYDEPGSPSEDELASVQLMARTAAVAIERDRSRTALLTQFSDLQRSLLPPQLPDVPGLNASASFHPGSRSVEVGGDFYDLFAVGGDSWGFMIGDVCGHGTEAAAATATARHTARAVALRDGDAGEVMEAVNTALLRSGFGRFATMIFGFLTVDGSMTRITLCRAGHPAPLVVRADGEVEELDVHGPALGIWPDITVPRTRVELGPGESLVMYTDGVTERNPNVDQKVGLAPLLRQLGGQQAAVLLAGVETGALSRQELRDDAAIFVLSNAAGAPPPDAQTAGLDLSYPASPESVPRARRTVTEFAESIPGVGVHLLERIRLAVSEAVTNSVVHAYPEGGGSFRVTAAAGRDGLEITIADGGCGYLRPTRRPGLGMGLSVIADSCDELTVTERPDGGTGVSMRFSLDEAARPRAAAGVSGAPPART